MKAHLTPENHLSDGGGIFYEELLNLFPQLNTKLEAARFWKMYRHGILHQATFSSETEKGLPAGAFANVHGLVVAPDRRLFLNPVDFARCVTEAIEADFETFEGAASSAPPLAELCIVPLVMAAPITIPSLPIPATTVAYLDPRKSI